MAKVDFATFLKQLTDRKIKGMFRLAWQMDYPSIENFLTPIYRTGAASNYMDYSNPEFDKLLVEAAAATDPAGANAKYQEAEALLAKDMPVHPDVVHQVHDGLVGEGRGHEDHRVRHDRPHLGVRQVTI